MSADLSRLLRPKSVAVIGGGAWCRSVVEQLIKGGFDGDIWPVHPRATDICGLSAFDGVPNLPAAPDAAFVGINRDATIGAVERLARRGAGGAVCFASGFAEVEDGEDRNAALLKAAGRMPILGPNCYGVINALDGALLWPDQHGCVPVQRGVAILTQSSNIAINLTMQARGLPIGYVITTGNQAQISQARAAMALLDDPRVTAIGVHVEGFGNLREWEALGAAAAKKQVPIVALKVGASAEAQAATVSHTASLAGSDAGAQAFLARLGIAQVADLPTFLETLKVLHCCGPLASPRIASISCSGGEASLMADIGQAEGVTFPALKKGQIERLSRALGPRVSLANPLDYHTYIWRDVAKMTEAFSAMADPGIQMICLVVDFPRADRCDRADWDCAVEAAIATRQATDRPVAMLASLPELMPEDVAAHLMTAGVVPLMGMREGLAALRAAVTGRRSKPPSPVMVGRGRGLPRLLTEAEAKAVLAGSGLDVPRSVVASVPEAEMAAKNLTPPFVVKGQGLAHKTEAGAVRLNLDTPRAVATAAQDIGHDSVLIEEMVAESLFELLIGVVRDPAHGFVLTLGAGGIWTEVMQDSTSVLIPETRAGLEAALRGLRSALVFDGFRGAAPVSMEAVLDAIMAVQDYVVGHADGLEEVEINPLICTATRAVAVDALIRRTDD